MNQALPSPGPVLGLYLQEGAVGGPKRNLALTGLSHNWHCETPHKFSSFKAVSELSPCHNVKELLCVGLHWCVPFIEDLSETVQVVW